MAKKSDASEEMPKINFDDPRWKIVGRGIYAKKGIPFSLDLLRKALELTQEEVAVRANMTQSEVSKMEQREDWKLSTLSRYVAALGGKLQLFVRLNGQQFEIGVD